MFYNKCFGAKREMNAMSKRYTFGTLINILYAERRYRMLYEFNND